MEFDTRNWLVICSGSATVRRSKVFSDQETSPSRADFLRIFFSFFGSSPALRRSFTFSISCSGAWTTTVPSVS